MKRKMHTASVMPEAEIEIFLGGGKTLNEAAKNFVPAPKM